MVRITRGISLHISPAEDRLLMGLAGSLSLDRVPLVLWCTYESSHLDESGMVVNVTEITNALRSELIRQPVGIRNAEVLLDWAWEVMRDKFEHCRLRRLTLDIHKSLGITRDSEEPEMIQITTKYELAASHRLWNRKWDEQRNRQMFGKCSNPAGHGHNYLLEVTISGQPDAETGRVASPDDIDMIVREQIIERFDHKNINEDTHEFAERMPTVENMAQVFWERLVGRFDHAQLVRIKLWETSSTYAEYYGPE